MSNTPPCPSCGGPLHSEGQETIWNYRDKFYCSENCCKIAMGIYRA